MILLDDLGEGFPMFQEFIKMLIEYERSVSVRIAQCDNVPYDPRKTTQKLRRVVEQLPKSLFSTGNFKVTIISDDIGGIVK